MESKIYKQSGSELGTILLPDVIFGLPWNADLVHQVVVSMQSSARNNIAHAKTRAEVRGGGKKPWRQKGTGQARHGSTRSPIWVGGGVAHGPRNDKNYDRKVNKKMRTKALFTILSRKYKEGEVTFIDEIALANPKTKDALTALSTIYKIPSLKNVAGKKTNALFIALPERSETVSRSFRNIGNVTIEETRNINPVSLMNYRHIVFVAPEETIRVLEAKLENKDGSKGMKDESKKAIVAATPKVAKKKAAPKAKKPARKSKVASE